MVLSIRTKKLVIPEYDIYETAFDGVFWIKRITAGILGEHNVPTNQELLALTGDAGYSPPMGYYPSVFSRKMLMNDFQKNLNIYPWFPDEEALERATDAMELILRPHFHGAVRTFDDALANITKSTSPGYPWNKGYKTKGMLIEVVDEVAFLRSCIVQILQTGKLDATWVCKGISYHLTHVYWQSSPKGEIRPIDKLLHPDPEKRKTRTFMCGDILSWFLGYMLYGDQNDAFLEMSRTSDWSAVGMSPFYGGWDRMAKFLIGPDGEECEMHCLDASHMETFRDNIQTRIYRLRNKMIVNADAAVRNGMKFYANSIIYKYYITPDGWLIFVTGNNPSGGFNTLVDNTLALQLDYLYCLSVQSTSVTQILMKYHSIRAKMIGDDSIYAKTPYLVDLINVSTQIGFELKYEKNPCPLREAVFLNAGFVKQGGYWFMFPNFEKLRASVFYLWKSRSWRLAYVKVCAYRKLCYPFPKQRQEADLMLRYIREHHDSDMQREHSMDDKISYASTLTNLMSDKDNLFLLTGLESLVMIVDEHSGLAREVYTGWPVDRYTPAYVQFQGWFSGNSATLSEDSQDLVALGSHPCERIFFESS